MGVPLVRGSCDLCSIHFDVLSLEPRGGLRNQSWSLSAVNDWNSFTDAGTTTPRTHGPTHEILTIGAAAVTHGSRGNMTTDEFAITRTYDWNNKVSQAVVPTGSVRGIVGTHSYMYDALGRRVRKSIGGSSPSDTVFVHLGEQIYADYTAGAAATSPDKKYVWGSYVDELVCQINGTTKYYIHRNQQYSTTSITAQSGTPAERYGYTSYGDLRTLNPNTLGIRTTPPMTRYTYTGREYDHEAGTYHFRARSYTATLGRFTGHDPIEYPDEFNTYAGWFAVSNTDPSGLIPDEWICPIGGGTNPPAVSPPCPGWQNGGSWTIINGQVKNLISYGENTNINGSWFYAAWWLRFTLTGESTIDDRMCCLDKCGNKRYMDIRVAVPFTFQFDVYMKNRPQLSTKVLLILLYPRLNKLDTGLTGYKLASLGISAAHWKDALNHATGTLVSELCERGFDSIKMQLPEVTDSFVISPDGISGPNLKDIGAKTTIVGSDGIPVAF